MTFGGPYHFIAFFSNKGCNAISALGDTAFQHLALVINRPPKVMLDAVNFCKRFIQNAIANWSNSAFGWPDFCGFRLQIAGQTGSDKNGWFRDLHRCPSHVADPPRI